MSPRYIFPGVGLGAIAAGALSITDEDFTVAAQCLARQVSEERLAQGCAYPPIKEIRDVSVKIAAAVAESIVKDGRASPEVLAAKYSPEDLYQRCVEMMYDPHY